MKSKEHSALPDWNDPTLEDKLTSAYKITSISEKEKKIVQELLAPLKETHPITAFHYQHSIRVGLYAQKIASWLHLDQRELFLGGLLHDIGKSCVPLELLAKTDLRLNNKNSRWTAKDKKRMEVHVMEGYHRIKEKAQEYLPLEIIADIVVRHHRYQPNPYPEQLPPFPHQYNNDTKERIQLYAQLVALADKYDALHRITKIPPFTAEEIKEKMHHLTPETRLLVDALYQVREFKSFLH
ncbi:HD domain-containing protein [Candidatus Woesearchaeota archaeon]|nr:HD domain-containing protein [Candidatus Woesearchaeota archaeon]